MTSRKPQPALLYTSALAQGWTRALTSFIDDGLAALCKRQWQQAPLVISRATPSYSTGMRGLKSGR
jgi:hypothetical protein